MSAVLVLVVTEGEVSNAKWHVAMDPGGNYGTLCGLATDDGVNIVTEESTTARTLCNCSDCFHLWKSLNALMLRASDFAQKHLK